MSRKRDPKQTDPAPAPAPFPRPGVLRGGPQPGQRPVKAKKKKLTWADQTLTALPANLTTPAEHYRWYLNSPVPGMRIRITHHWLAQVSPRDPMNASNLTQALERLDPPNFYLLATMMYFYGPDGIYGYNPFMFVYKLTDKMRDAYTYGEMLDDLFSTGLFTLGNQRERELEQKQAILTAAKREEPNLELSMVHLLAEQKIEDEHLQVNSLFVLLNYLWINPYPKGLLNEMNLVLLGITSSNPLYLLISWMQKVNDYPLRILLNQAEFFVIEMWPMLGPDLYNPLQRLTLIFFYEQASVIRWQAARELIMSLGQYEVPDLLGNPKEQEFEGKRVIYAPLSIPSHLISEDREMAEALQEWYRTWQQAQILQNEGVGGKPGEEQLRKLELSKGLAEQRIRGVLQGVFEVTQDLLSTAGLYIVDPKLFNFGYTPSSTVLMNMTEVRDLYEEPGVTVRSRYERQLSSLWDDVKRLGRKVFGKDHEVMGLELKNLANEELQLSMASFQKTLSMLEERKRRLEELRARGGKLSPPTS